MVAAWTPDGGGDEQKRALSVSNEGRGTGFSISRSRRAPGGGHGNPLQYSCLKNPHGQKSLPDYSPWGHKESDPVVT